MNNNNNPANAAQRNNNRRGVNVTDLHRLHHILTEFFGVDPRNIQNDPLFIALTSQGYRGVNNGLIYLTDKGIDALRCPDPATGAPTELQDFTKHGLRIVCHMIHDFSNKAGGLIEVRNIDEAKFNMYRGFMYKHGTPILFWNQPRHNDIDPELKAWNRNIKVSMSDFKELRDPYLFFYHRRDWISTAKAVGLYHCLIPPDPLNTSVNPEVDKAQSLFIRFAHNITSSITNNATFEDFLLICFRFIYTTL